MRSSRHLVVVSVIVLTARVFFPQEWTHACAMCQTVLPRGDDPLARGFFWSVLILLTAPFIVTGAIGGWVYYHYRKPPSSKHAAPTSLVPIARLAKPGDVS